MPFTFAAFLIASISIIGLPPSGGSWSKWLLALGAAETGQVFLLATLMISSLLNIAYLIPIPILAFMVPKGEQPLPFKEGPMLCRDTAVHHGRRQCCIVFLRKLNVSMPSADRAMINI